MPQRVIFMVRAGFSARLSRFRSVVNGALSDFAPGKKK
jgi:hypothetical protein